MPSMFIAKKWGTSKRSITPQENWRESLPATDIARNHQKMILTAAVTKSCRFKYEPNFISLT